MRPMHFPRVLALLIAILAIVAPPSLAGGASERGFYLRDGDCVVFYGDSITARRVYITFVETYAVTRYPHLRLRFLNGAWGGDRVSGGEGGTIDVRLRRDVFAYKPTVVTIMLGMNDAGYRPFDETLFHTYVTGYQHILDAVRKHLPGIRITLLEPSAFDDVTRPPQFPGGYNAVLIRYGQFVRELGEREGLAVVDPNTPTVAVLEKAKAIDPETAKAFIPDRVHPDPAGSLPIAEALLKAWHAPSLVTSVEIDAAHHRVVRTENTRVTGLHAESRLSWTQLDNALPMPVNMNDPALALAVRNSDFEQALDEQPVKVTGLGHPRYALKIDGEQIGTFTRAQLEEGINLALLPTPMAKQAMSVHDLVGKRGLVGAAKSLLIEWPLRDLHLTRIKAVLDALGNLQGELSAREHAAAQPKPRRYELVPQ